MSESLWKDPLESFPADHDQVWISVRANDTKPVLAYYTVADASYHVSVMFATFVIPAWQVFSWRPV